MYRYGCHLTSTMCIKYKQNGLVEFGKHLFKKKKHASTFLNLFSNTINTKLMLVEIGLPICLKRYFK